MELLQEFSECLLLLGAVAESVEICERGLGLDRTREGLYVQLMRSHANVGHLGEALRVYERCRRALAEELGVDPGAAARAMHAQLLREDEPGEDAITQASPSLTTTTQAERNLHISGRAPATAAPLHVPYVGRARERADLVRRLDATLGGQGQIVLRRTGVCVGAVGTTAWHAHSVLA